MENSELPDNTPPSLPRMPTTFTYLSQVIMILGLYIIMNVIFFGLGAFIAEQIAGVTLKVTPGEMEAAPDTASQVFGYKIMQLIVSAGSFIGTALVFTRIARERPSVYFGFSRLVPDFRSLLYIFIIVLLSQPVISYLSGLNHSFDFSQIAPGYEQVIQEQQNTMNSLQRLFLRADNISVLLFNLLVIAVIPAVGEELLFRGALLQVFYRLTHRIHFSIFFVAFLFAFIHLEFLDFLPLMAMGAILGYVYYWSGNIMVPIWLHFLNNAMAVVSIYMHQSYPDVEQLSYDYTFPWVQAAIGMLGLAAALFFFHRHTKRQQA